MIRDGKATARRRSSDRQAPSFPLSSPAWRQRLRRRLLAWFDRTARDMPWRRARDPYRIWVSEIMLQQTQVATVERYYERFLAAFPDVAALAAADEQDVLKLWEGLGYYRRARQMHRAARAICEKHDGRFPRDPARLRELPGIGRYTAGAILSIAFDKREPILEANTVRLVSRLAGYDGDPRSVAGQRTLWEFVAEWLPRRRAGAFNQAIMELGSLVCTPREPECTACPVTNLCEAHRLGLVERIPRPARRVAVESVREAAIVVRRGSRVLLLKRGDNERWAGLWDFPRFGVKSTAPKIPPRELKEAVAQLTGIVIEPAGRIATIKHGVTRFRITLDCHEARYVSASNRQRHAAPRRWVQPTELASYPLSVTGRKLSRLLVAEATP